MSLYRHDARPLRLIGLVPAVATQALAASSSASARARAASSTAYSASTTALYAKSMATTRRLRRSRHSVAPRQVVLRPLAVDVVFDLRDVLIPVALHVAPPGGHLFLAGVGRLAQLLGLVLSRCLRCLHIAVEIGLRLTTRCRRVILSFLGRAASLPNWSERAIRTSLTGHHNGLTPPASECQQT